MVDSYDDLDEQAGYEAVSGQDALIELNALLGRGTRYSGKLHFDGRVRIEGAFEGEIRGDDVLIIGEGAEVNGTIEVGCCIVTGGVVRASIRAVDAIELHAPAIVHGDLHAPNIFIDRGVQFEGNCKMAPLSGYPPPVLRTVAKTVAATPIWVDEAAHDDADDEHTQPSPTTMAAPQRPVTRRAVGPASGGQAAAEPPPAEPKPAEPQPAAAVASYDEYEDYDDDEFDDDEFDDEDDYEDDEFDDEDDYEDDEFDDSDPPGPAQDAVNGPPAARSDELMATLEPVPRRRSRQRLPEQRRALRAGGSPPAAAPAAPRSPARPEPASPAPAVAGVHPRRRRRRRDPH